MAKRRKTTLTRRRQTSLAAAGKRKTTRRRSSRRRGMMAELFSASTATAAVKGIALGAAGGMLAGGVHRLVKDKNAGIRIGTGLVASFLTYSVGNFPNMAAGMAGAFAALESQGLYSKFMADGDQYMDYADASALNEMPVYLNEAGEPVYLNEDIDLAEEIYLSQGIYPQYNTNY